MARLGKASEAPGFYNNELFVILLTEPGLNAARLTIGLLEELR
jgi:hypothetical protein